MKIEDAFAISIADAEAQSVVTVNDLFDLVIRKIEPSSGEMCITSFLFYNTRKALMELFAVGRSDIKTESKLSSLIPADNMYVNWKKFENRMRVKIPELERPNWIKNIIIFPSVAFWIFGLLFAIIKNWWLSLSTVVFAIMYQVIITRLTRSQKIIIPRYSDKISDFIYRVLSTNQSIVANRKKYWSKKEVFKVIQSIISGQVALPLEKILGESSLVDDLGID